ncbi:MAG: type I-F CRISPR-associated protein Csy3 [Proteobacteria bacterium]|nr:type I-F CRISPR-associated protein Csy3 [Pseudomonadota bacterium]
MTVTNRTPALTHLPSVLAFRRAIVVTDAPFEFMDGDGDVKPVNVIRHGTMGTQNVNEKQKPGASTAKEGERDVRNLQEIESAKTGADMSKVVVSFQVKAISLANTLHSCANTNTALKTESAQLREMIADFVTRAEASEGLDEVSRRTARNILNGRWLWRNRLIASAVQIAVVADEQSWSVDALTIPTSNFDGYSEAEKGVAAVLAAQLRGESMSAIQVKATIDFGVTGAIEVYGSQNYEPDTKKSGKGGLSRSLYKLASVAEHEVDGVRVVGQAAFRDAKIWNALRTIDTWYADYSVIGAPMPIEPLGASLSAMRFLRDKKDSAFTLFKRLHLIDPSSAEGMFCIAIMMRGGVLGEEEKTRAKADAADTALVSETVDAAE